MRRSAQRAGSPETATPRAARGPAGRR